MSTKQGIEILAARLCTIYIRYGLIYNLARLKVGDVIQENGLQYADHLFLCDIFLHNQTAIRESLVGIDTSLVLVPVGRHHSHQVVHREFGIVLFIGRLHSVENHHRAVKETIGMIVHEAASD
jgi:hypothetical protein